MFMIEFHKNDEKRELNSASKNLKNHTASAIIPVRSSTFWFWCWSIGKRTRLTSNSRCTDQAPGSPSEAWDSPPWRCPRVARDLQLEIRMSPLAVDDSVESTLTVQSVLQFQHLRNQPCLLLLFIWTGIRLQAMRSRTGAVIRVRTGQRVHRTPICQIPGRRLVIVDYDCRRRWVAMKIDFSFRTLRIHFCFRSHRLPCGSSSANGMLSSWIDIFAWFYIDSVGFQNNLPVFRFDWTTILLLLSLFNSKMSIFYLTFRNWTRFYGAVDSAGPARDESVYIQTGWPWFLASRIQWTLLWKASMARN